MAVAASTAVVGSMAVDFTAADFTVVGSMAVDFTAADFTVVDFTVVDFTAAASTADGMAGLPACILDTRATGIMAGTADGMAGGWLAPDWDGRIMTIPGGAPIRITTTASTANLTPVRTGTIATILRGITRM
jgi:hypothetical protein